MTARLARRPLLTLATLALSGTLAWAQTPAAPAPAAAPAPPAAPIERQPPSDGPMRPEMRPGMRQGMRPEMRSGEMHPGMMRGQGSGRGNFRGAGRMHSQGNDRGNFHGGFHGPQLGGQPHGEGFHGPELGGPHGGMGEGFHIAPPGMWWKSPMIVQRLTLTPDQVKRMDGIFQQSRIQLIDLKANVEKQEVMLEPMLSANPPDTAKASLQIDKVADARASLEKANAKMLLGIRGVLTPDQWTKLSARGGPGTASAPGQPSPADSGGPGPAAMRGRVRRFPPETAAGPGPSIDDTRP